MGSMQKLQNKCKAEVDSHYKNTNDHSVLQPYLKPLLYCRGKRNEQMVSAPETLHLKTRVGYMQNGGYVQTTLKLY